MKNYLLVTAGVIGGASLFTISATKNVFLFGLSLLGFGVAFIFLQSTLISASQEKMPKLRGTAMSITSFNMFVGGAVGTALNGRIMNSYGTSQIFFNTSFVMLIVGLVAAVLVARFEMRKRQRLALQPEKVRIDQ